MDLIILIWLSSAELSTWPLSSLTSLVIMWLHEYSSLNYVYGLISAGGVYNTTTLQTSFIQVVKIILGRAHAREEITSFLFRVFSHLKYA